MAIFKIFVRGHFKNKYYILCFFYIRHCCYILTLPPAVNMALSVRNSSEVALSERVWIFYKQDQTTIHERNMAEYHSCVHLLPETISKAIRKVKEVHSSHRTNDACVYHCLDCDCRGKLSDKAFKAHARDNGHTVGVRMKDPAELYCFSCQDFQFSSHFDRFTKRKRARTGLYYSRFGTKPSKASTAHGSCGQVKGLCNMGATCFMSAVLQVLMKNTILMNCDQMHSNVDRCKTIIERSASIDNTSRQSGDSATNQTTNAAATCIYCEFKKVCIETTR